MLEKEGFARMEDTLPVDFINQLKKSIEGELRTDPVTRVLYSTDASLYQIKPMGVVLPRSAEELAVVMDLAAKFCVPVLPRGGGSSLAGQAVGRALILDTSRYLTRIIEIDSEQRRAVVEPGVVLSHLNRAAAIHGLTFGPDPASADRATVGGSVANNATGAHSILYGMAADHLLSACVVLSDGSEAEFSEITLQAAQIKAMQNTLEGAWYRAALGIRESHGDAIRQHWPKVWRRASGYNINYLLPWSPSFPPQWNHWASNELQGVYPPSGENHINLAPLLAGSEGTLGILRRLTLRLVPLQSQTILGVLAFDGIAEACDAAADILDRNPSAIELIPGSMIRLARSVPAYAHQLTFVQGEPEALLVVEFSGEPLETLREKARLLSPDVLIAENPEQQNMVWNVRKVGLGLLGSSPGDAKPLAFIEDLSVPVVQLGHFVREMERIMRDHGTYGEFYAHASAGCLHIRPVLNLKRSVDRSAMRSIARQAVELTLSLGGAVSGEHGDGLSRSQWMEQAFGSEIIGVFRTLKQAADPHNLMNPGKILDAQPLDDNLRYGEFYQSRPWPTTLDFSSQIGLSESVEMCNGAGVCRKSGGLMCPSFQATREEKHSTRGRANLLRAMMAGEFSTYSQAETAVYQALDLCLACKGCKAECPSAVDMAKLKYAFLERYYSSHSHPVRDYVFGYIHQFAELASRLPVFTPLLFGEGAVAQMFKRFLGIAPDRPLPRPVPHSNALVKEQPSTDPTDAAGRVVLLLTDAFSRYFHPQTELAARAVLEAVGKRVVVLPVIGAGRTLISKGFLSAARKHALDVLESIKSFDPGGEFPVIGIEPSEIYTLKEEYPDFFPADDYARQLRLRALMIDEYLIRPGVDGVAPIELLAGQIASKNGLDSEKVWLHAHCYQKAQPPAEDGLPGGAQATSSMLVRFGYRVMEIDSGCCGMAGAFGYEAEHYQLSMEVGELRLFPALRSVQVGGIVAAAGTSCRSQILDGTGITALHPVELLMRMLEESSA